MIIDFPTTPEQDKSLTNHSDGLSVNDFLLKILTDSVNYYLAQDKLPLLEELKTTFKDKTAEEIQAAIDAAK